MTEAAQGSSEQAGLPPGAELRAAPRSSLMCRSAKILCESGEYVCVVRDVSATGTRLRLFHEPPPDEHLFLELGNGERYAMERVWAANDHAGFRFSCLIDVDHFIAERGSLPRRPMRLRIQRPGIVRVEGIESPVMVTDLSQHGACIEAGRKFAIEQMLRLDIDTLPLRMANVRWRRGYTHGLALQHAFRLDELARHAFALQPYPAAPPAGTGASRVARYG